LKIKDEIIKKIENIPEQYLTKILDFIQIIELKDKVDNVLDTSLVSESSLKKDWLRPEEDEAWQDL
jgi:hypothetical protein